jgi:D-alanyl-D-alanine dipeptidase
LDLTLIDLKTKKELKMPIPFDALVYAAHPEFMKLPEEVIKNRELLKTVMQKHGLLKCSFFPTVKNSN